MGASTLFVLTIVVIVSLSVNGATISNGTNANEDHSLEMDNLRTNEIYKEIATNMVPLIANVVGDSARDDGSFFDINLDNKFNYSEELASGTHFCANCLSLAKTTDVHLGQFKLRPGYLTIWCNDQDERFLPPGFAIYKTPMEITSCQIQLWDMFTHLVTIDSMYRTNPNYVAGADLKEVEETTIVGKIYRELKATKQIAEHEVIHFFTSLFHLW